MPSPYFILDANGGRRKVYLGPGTLEAIVPTSGVLELYLRSGKVILADDNPENRTILRMNQE